MVSQFKSPRIDIVFDQYFIPSTKDCERLHRNETTSTISIGPNQIWHHNFAESLSCEEHKEADTRIIHHICQISVDAQVVVRYSDSDILIILLGNLDHQNASLKLWIQWSVGNHERVISINGLYQDLGISLSKALPCFYVITGCDYTPAFFRKGKLRPFKLLEKSVEYQLAWQEIITDDEDELEPSGWIVNDDKHDFVWFAGEQFPSSVVDIVIKKPTLLENQNTTQDDDYDDIDNNGSSDDDETMKMHQYFETLLRN
ncbi:hypothetical protein TNCV_2695311 [Trichonephila clavipes]|nr:hypothetical protein TNCV_2695311 [Trichonephila clavipes]